MRRLSGAARAAACVALAALAGCGPRLTTMVPLHLMQREQVASPPGEALYALTFRDADGGEITGFLRRPLAEGPPRTGVVVVAGRETGREAAAVIPGPLEEVILALEYPDDLPTTGTAGEWVRRLPAMRRTAYRMPGLLRGAGHWLAEQPEVAEERIALVGVSYGVPFAAAAARDTLFRGVSLQHGGADLALLLRTNLPIRNRALRNVAAAFGGWYLRRLEPARHVDRIAPRPLLLINATYDDMVPRESAERLLRAAREPVRQIWLPHGHLMPGDDHLMRELADSTLSHFDFLREPPRRTPGPRGGAAPDGAERGAGTGEAAAPAAAVTRAEPSGVARGTGGA